MDFLCRRIQGCYRWRHQFKDFVRLAHRIRGKFPHHHYSLQWAHDRKIESHFGYRKRMGKWLLCLKYHQSFRWYHWFGQQPSPLWIQDHSLNNLKPLLLGLLQLLLSLYYHPLLLTLCRLNRYPSCPCTIFLFRTKVRLAQARQLLNCPE